MTMFSFLDYGGVKDKEVKPEYYLSYSNTTILLRYNYSPSPLQKHYNACQARLKESRPALLNPK
jgi:hypothetical protein